MREDGGGEKRLVGYVTARADTPLDLNVLRAHAKETLPDYMVPSALVVLDALPLSPNGKLDRRALPAPAASSLDAAEYVAPEGPTERTLAAIWGEVLHLDRVSAKDNFFALGGHSLLAVRVTSRVRRDLGVKIEVRALFANPTLRSLAATLAAQRVEIIAKDAPPAIAKVERGGPLPLSFTQERLWALTQLEPDSTAYHISDAERLEGDLDVAILERAFREVVARHEVLRSTIVEIDGRPAQIIGAVPDFVLGVTDLTGASETEVRRHVDEHAVAPFDLPKRAMRATLLKLGPRHHILLIAFHHIASDGWSMGLFGRELSALYAAFAAQRRSPLAPMSLQFADYAAWQRAEMTSDRAAAAVAYWKQHLAGAPPALDLPTDRPHAPSKNRRGEVESLVLSPELTQAMRRFAKASGASMFMTMLAVYALVLSRQAGQEDVVVGLPIVERSRPELEGLIGNLLNAIALRVSTAGNPTFRALVDRAREASLAGFAHQDILFDRLIQELQVDRGLTRTPVFQVMLVSVTFDNASPVELPGIDVSRIDRSHVDAKYDISLYFDDSQGALELTFVYDADLFDRARMRDLLAQIADVIKQGVDAPDTRVDDLSLVTSAARRHVLPDPRAPLDETWRGAVTDIFEEKAASAPSRLAITDAYDVWSYGELDARANQLAHLLLAAGCQRGDRVAIIAHRSASLPLAVLGVLKAGTAFVMIDPALCLLD
jgi:hypothetical protein